MCQIGDLNKVILYSSIFFLIFGFGITSFNESFAEEQEFDDTSISSESNTSTDNKQNNSKDKPKNKQNNSENGKEKHNPGNWAWSDFFKF